jgi:hypothetical protein
MLAGMLAVTGLQATPAFADAVTTRTFATVAGVGELCTTAGEVTYDAGAITIDVGNLAPEISEVVIASDAVSGCLGQITSLNWTGTHPLSKLTVQSGAFQQYDMVSTLASVNFPDAVTSITVGEQAFYQYSQDGDNALGSVTFPSGLTSLELGDWAFTQLSPNGKNALTSIDFPSGLGTLDIGERTFYQWGSAGEALKTLRFPGSLTSLTIGPNAFTQNAGPVLASVILDRAAAWPTPPVHTLAIDTTAFQKDSPTWYWFGPDGTSVSSAWNGTFGAGSLDPILVGYRTVTFDTTGGGSAPAPQYLYRGGGQWSQPTVLDTIPEGAWTSSGLPSASREDYSLSGWCATSASSCPALLPVGGSYSVTASETLYAIWTPKAPRAAGPLSDATVGVAYHGNVAAGGDLTCSVTSGALPAGLSLSGCVFSGTPTAAGAFGFTIKATNGAGSNSQAFTLTVKHAAPLVTAATLPTPTVTVPYSAPIAVSGGGTITCALSVGSLPPGLKLTGCALTGTPTKAGSYPFTVAASNDGGTGSKAFTVMVAPAKKFTKVYQPTISGTAKVGKTLTAKVKTWKPKPTSVSWQWYRNGVAIPGATKSKYKLTRGDKGTKITVTTVGSRLGYQSSSTSKSTARVK